MEFSQATLNAFDELSSKVPFFKYLSEELETKNFPEDSTPTGTKLLVNAINSVLHYLARLRVLRRRRRDLPPHDLSIDLPTKEEMVSLIEERIVSEARAITERCWRGEIEDYFIQRAKTEFEQWVSVLDNTAARKKRKIQEVW